jgi:hypothetical protein
MLGGHLGAYRYSIIFAIAGTAADFATLRLSPLVRSYSESIFGNNGSSQKGDWLKLPEWSPIRVLDEEAVAAKQAREQQLYAQRVELGKLSKEESWEHLVFCACFSSSLEMASVDSFDEVGLFISAISRSIDDLAASPI